MADDQDDAQDGAQENAEQDDTSVAVLFELENLLVGAREHSYKAMESALKKKSISLSAQLYSKCCLTRGLAGSLALVSKSSGGDDSVPDIADDIKEAIDKSITSKSTSVNEDFAKLLKGLSKADVRLGALSHLSSETADGILALAGLDGLEITLNAETGSGARLFTKDAWSALAREVGVCRPHCAVIGTSAAACRTALSANMRSIVIPDRF